MLYPRAYALVIGFAVVSGSAAAQDRLFALTDYLFPQLVELNPATGGVMSAVPVTGHESLFGGLAVDDAGSLFSIDGYNDPNPDRTFRIDSATGAGTVVGPTGFNWNFRTVYVHPVTDTLYAATDNQLFTINKTTGAATPVASITAPPGSGLDQLTALAINAQGQAFITDIGDTTLFSLNLQTGQATKIADVGQASNWFDDLAFDSAGVLHGVRLNGGVYTINTATGAETFLFGGIYKGLAFIGDDCYADCNADGVLTVADFGCFQTKFVAGDPYADCNGDGVRTVADFGCFQTLFVTGCP